MKKVIGIILALILTLALGIAIANACRAQPGCPGTAGVIGYDGLGNMVMVCDTCGFKWP